jgi:hypothetical protein
MELEGPILEELKDFKNDDTQLILGAQEIDLKIKTVKSKFIENFLEMAHLLAEIYNHQYYYLLGYEGFKEYVELSDLDINTSVAYRMVKMANSMKELQIGTDSVKEVKPTKLLEIFSLNPKENEGAIRSLLEDGKTSTTDQVKSKVRKHKGLDEAVFYRFSVEKDTSELTIEPAMEKIKRKMGSDVDKFGEVAEPSGSKCFEFICAEYLNMKDE